MTTKFAPFANGTDVITLGERSIENHEGSITLVGDWTIERTKSGLAQAKLLVDTMQRAIDVMSEDAKVGALPDVLPNLTAPSKSITNPFAQS